MKAAIMLVSTFVMLGFGTSIAQQEQEVVEETVRVVNVEVPVRVYYKNQSVDNLTQKDFKLYEGRKQQDIHGFILKRKKIKIQEVVLTADQKKIMKPRFFVLVFRITHYNDHLKKGLDHVFDHILTGSDQLLVFVNNRSANFPDLKDKMTVKSKLDNLLRDIGTETRNKTLLYLQAIESELEKHKFDMELKTGSVTNKHVYINQFLTKYARIWKDYKKKYLVPDINKYYNFSRFLKNIPIEKWVINFYQFELFPDIMINSSNMRRIKALVGQWQASDGGEQMTFARIISRQLVDLEQDLSIAKDFPAEEVAKIFHNVDATFHSIFMKTTLATLREDMEYREVASELENSLRAITDRTGGELVVSNQLDTALDKISEVEDLYYILTYAPNDPEKVGKIKIKMSDRKYKAVYSPNLRQGYLRNFFDTKEIKGTPVKIKACRFKNKKLSVTIGDFFYHEEHGARLTIRIQVKNQQGAAVFDQKKQINATQREINLSLNFSGIGSGKYNIIVDVEDLATKRKATELIQGRIVPSP